MVTWSSRRRRRAMCLLLVRLLLAATSWGLGAGDIASTPPGGETHFSCSAKGPEVTWEWEPLYPKCAGVKSTWTLIYSIDRNGAHRVESDRFKGRLTVTAGPQSGEFKLVLKDAVMSDSGLYSCSPSTGPVGDRLNLTVTAGCHRGFRVTLASQNVTPKLGEPFSFYCTACDGTELPSDSFDWIVSGRPISTDSSGYLLGRRVLSVLAVDERIEGGVRCGVGGQRSELCPRVDRPSGQDSPSTVSTATLQPGDQTAVSTSPLQPTNQTAETETAPGRSELGGPALVLGILAGALLAAIGLGAAAAAAWSRKRDRERKRSAEPPGPGQTVPLQVSPRRRFY
ncbi:uncharacterized protein [Lepisosteus oculatus]|uniref:uncharacterized protein isoform X2 n=1 Tax=Lepisosteus oculatus TaxID=7918 RepID=UPI0035F50994